MSDGKVHSIISPSAASRWCNCTPSALLCQKHGKNETSDYAEEGTLAHEIAAVWINNYVYYLQTKKAMKQCIEKLDELKKHRLFAPEMIDEVKKYTDFIVSQQEKSKGKMYAEVEVPLYYRPEDTGTLDNMIIDGEDSTLYINDLKYGKGVLVEAKNNKQLLIYALSAIDFLNAQRKDKGYAPERVVMSIVQPRRDYIDTWELSIDEIEMYRDEIQAKANKAVKGEGNFKPGDHCRFCDVKNRCRAMKEYADNAVKSLGDDPALLSISEIAKIIGIRKMLTDWLDSVAAFALEQAIAGVAIEGFKLVEGRSNRKFTDEKALKAALIAAGYEANLLTRSSFLTLTELQKVIDKADFEQICEKYIEKPDGAPTLVEASDPREDFGVIAARRELADYLQ